MTDGMQLAMLVTSFSKPVPSSCCFLEGLDWYLWGTVGFVLGCMTTLFENHSEKNYGRLPPPLAPNFLYPHPN